MLFYTIWYFKQLNWPVGTNHCSAHREPSFAQASIYKSLNLSETQPVFNAVKAVQTQAIMPIQFQFGSTEIQLQITCVQTHWGTARESGSRSPLLCQYGLRKAIYSHNLRGPSAHSTTHFKATNFLCKRGIRRKVLSSPHVQSEQSYHNGTEDVPVFSCFPAILARSRSDLVLWHLLGLTVMF